MGQQRLLEERRARMLGRVIELYETTERRHGQLTAILAQLNPRSALGRGYALVFGVDGAPLGNRNVNPGDTITIETNRYNLTVGVQDVTEKHS